MSDPAANGTSTLDVMKTTLGFTLAATVASARLTSSRLPSTAPPEAITVTGWLRVESGERIVRAAAPTAPADARPNRAFRVRGHPDIDPSFVSTRARCIAGRPALLGSLRRCWSLRLERLGAARRTLPRALGGSCTALPDRRQLGVADEASLECVATGPARRRAQSV